MTTRIQLARSEIFALLEQHETRIFRRRDLETILSANRREWRLAERMSFGEFSEYLKKSGKLRRLDFSFPHRKEIRYTWGDVPLLGVLLTLKPGCHFSHYTAMRMHGLTEQDPKTIYVNFEQPPKLTPVGELIQQRINIAFARKPRMTANVTRFGDVRICLLNGKSTGYLGIESREVLADEAGTVVVRVTDVERTLIDITVRPFYAGGVSEVLKAYNRAGSRASVNRLAALLGQLKYVYPYHQAVGFYLERSKAHSPHVIERFRKKFKQEFDFHLTYEMKETRYEAAWRLFVPKGF